MAVQVPFKKIRLHEDDVAGARLPNRVVSDNSVISLRRFLLVRGLKIPQAVRKPELIELVTDTINNDVPIDPSVDRGKWLTAKALAVRKNELNKAHSTSKLDTFPVVGWKTFPSILIPELFHYGLIYQHLIVTNQVEDDENDSARQPANEEDDNNNQQLPTTAISTAKPLRRGRQYFLDGHVQKIENAVSVQGHYCLRAKVQASMRKENFNVLVKLNKATAEVMDAGCQCKASSMGRCSHVSALLQALEDYVRLFGYTPPSCTSAVCQWNKGRKEKSSASAFQRQYTFKRDPSRLMNSNPIPDQDPVETCNHLLYCAQTTHVKSSWDMMLEYKYFGYLIDDERTQVLKILRRQLQDALRFGLATPGCIKGTQDQRDANTWYRLRTIMITASCCSKYLVEDQENIGKKINNLMWEAPSEFDNVYLRYGRDNEDEARRAYAELTGNVVSCTGLWVNPEFPGLGASPDGIVQSSPTGNVGLLEIKCCYMLRDHAPTDLWALTPEQRSRFYLKEDGNRFYLPRNHIYYKQIQMQMGITGLKWCDFVIWTRQGLFVERIDKDETWWKDASVKLMNVHEQLICPEYFEMRLPRKLPLIELPPCDLVM